MKTAACLFTALLFFGTRVIGFAQQSRPHFVLLIGNEREGKVYFLVYGAHDDKGYVPPKLTWSENDSTFDVDAWRNRQWHEYNALRWTSYLYTTEIRNRRVYLFPSYHYAGK